MSWDDLEPRAKSSTYCPEAVALHYAPASGPLTQRMRLTIKKPLVTGADLSWLVPGGTCGLHIGRGEHHGELRLTRNGRHRVMKSSGVGSNGGVMIAFEPLVPVPGGKLSCAVDFDFGDDWLQITLPSWARPTAPAPIPAPAPRPAAAPFKGALASGGMHVPGVRP